MSRTLWITGVSGFSGSHLAAHVSALPDRPRIVGLGLAPTSTAVVDEYLQVDVCDAQAVADVARRTQPSWVVHLAGSPPAAPSAALWRGHVGTALGLADGLSRADLASVRLLTIGSAAEYRESVKPLTERDPVGPVTEYGQAKLAQTLVSTSLPRTFGIHSCVARTFNLIGPGLPERFVLGRLCAEFLRAGADGEVRIRHLATSRDFVDVRDAADAYWRLVQAGRPGSIYNVCSGKAVSLTDLLALLSSITGTRPRVIETDAQRSRTDADVAVGSNVRLRRATGWTPTTPLHTSIADTLRAARALLAERDLQEAER